MCLFEFALLNKVHGGDQLANRGVNVDQEKCGNGQNQYDQHDTGGDHSCVSSAALHVCQSTQGELQVEDAKNLGVLVVASIALLCIIDRY